MPASGIAGLALGIVLAIQYPGHLAFALTDHVDEEVVRRVAAFVVIVLTTAVAMRIAASLVRKLLSYLLLRWLDHAAGAVAGAVAGLLAVGTVVYLLTGADVEQVQDLLQASSLASPISHASLITSSSPGCTELT